MVACLSLRVCSHVFSHVVRLNQFAHMTYDRFHHMLLRSRHTGAANHADMTYTRKVRGAMPFS